MDFVMSCPRRLEGAVQRLRDAGYSDASEVPRAPGDPEQHILSVTTEGVGCRLQVEWIVTQADPHSRNL